MGRQLFIFLIVFLSACSSTLPPDISLEDANRGSYRGSYYTVQKGDTLYFISYLTNKDVMQLAKLNNLSEPYTIYPGQKLNLWQPKYMPPSFPATSSLFAARREAASKVRVTSLIEPEVDTNSTSQLEANRKSEQLAMVDQQKQFPAAPKDDTHNVDKFAEPKAPKAKAAPAEPVKQPAPVTVAAAEPAKAPAPAKVAPAAPVKAPAPVKVAATEPAKAPAPAKTVAKTQNATPQNNGKIIWKWPAQGDVIATYSTEELGNKGVDIAGKRGQKIFAAAGGKVVYAGNALRGYGNLLIIKHNNDFLSAYAHNERFLVREGDSVDQGQAIATMGDSAAPSVRLHFEIRHKGKSVDPSKYLPRI
ncbi:MAG: peptidoglycan DD-metalloendopeptidase family protein [Vibrionaceae bacterium]